MAPGPLFVVAMWRSGSSLLYALLNKHPQVALTFEDDLWLLRSVFRKPAAYCDWAARWEFRLSAFARHGMVASDMPPGVADFRTAFTAFHKAYAARKGAVIWGDKSPVYYDALPELARLFPQARFIIQWRDPAATANAMARAAQTGAPWYQRRGIYLRGLIGYQVLKSGVDFLLSRGVPVCQVTYEELTSDTAKVMREVCSFLEISYHDELADLRGSDRSAVFKDPHHSVVKGDQIIRAPRTIILDLATRKKIDGYVKLWKRQYKDEWPPSVLADAEHVALPRLPQRIADRAAYHAVRASDRFRQICLAYVPLAWLKRYSSRRRGVRIPADKQTGEAQD